MEKLIKLALITGVLLITGCCCPARTASDVLTIASPYHAASQWIGRYHVVGTSVENRQIECLVLGEG